MKIRDHNLSPSKVITFIYVGTCLWPQTLHISSQMKQHELLIMRDIFSQRNVDHGCEQTFIHDIVYFFYTQDQEALST